MASTGRSARSSTSPSITTTKQRAYRATGTDTEATDLPPINPLGARYDDVKGPTNFYSSLNQEIPRQEIERRVGQPIDRYRLTEVDICGRLLDAFSHKGLLGLGLRRADLVQKDNTACLNLAAEARRLKCSGLIVPSAVDPSEANIVVWRDYVWRIVRVVGWTIVTVDLPPPEALTG